MVRRKKPVYSRTCRLMEKKVLCENQNYSLSVKHDFRKKINMKSLLSKNLKIIFHAVEEKAVCKE